MNSYPQIFFVEPVFVDPYDTIGWAHMNAEGRIYSMVLSKDPGFTEYIFRRHKEDCGVLFRDFSRVMEAIRNDYPRGLLLEMARQMGYKYVVVLVGGSNYYCVFTSEKYLVGVLVPGFSPWWS